MSESRWPNRVSSWSIACLSLLLTNAAMAVDSPLESVGDLVLVVGASGTADFGQQFATWAERWRTAARSGGWTVHSIGGAEPAPVNDHDRLKNLLHDLSATSKENENRRLWIVLIGHGTDDGREARFNLTGPDLTDRELSEWLTPLARPLAIINCSSSSATFLKTLSRRGRVVITATRNGTEENFAHYGEALSKAWTETAADLDQDGQVSLWEAFLRASAATAAFYESDRRLATEHAQLDDDGDGQGLLAQAALNAAADALPFSDGGLAQRWVLIASAAERKIPAALRQRRDEFEAELHALRRRAADFSEADYLQQLEAILLPIARLGADIEAAVQLQK